MNFHKYLSKSNDKVIYCRHYYAPSSCIRLANIVKTLSINNIPFSLISGGWNTFFDSDYYTCLIDFSSLCSIKYTKKFIVFAAGTTINQFVSSISKFTDKVNCLEGILVFLVVQSG